MAGNVISVCLVSNMYCEIIIDNETEERRTANTHIPTTLKTSLSVYKTSNEKSIRINIYI